MKSSVLFALILVLSTVFSGCGRHGPQMNVISMNTLPPYLNEEEENFWWRCKFRITWDKESDIDFGIDLFLAHGVIAPVLQENIDEITYWRFHRRASDDKAGHQFSFIFYSDDETATAIFDMIKSHPLLQEAQDRQVIETVIFDSTEFPENGDVEDTSDHHWPYDLQRNWPPFIMGVSATWLGLIDDNFIGPPEHYDSLDILLDEYREVDEIITDMWLNDGHHAFFHHINAIFGYEPVLIRKKMVF